jgi:hypothetical protein
MRCGWWNVWWSTISTPRRRQEWPGEIGGYPVPGDAAIEQAELAMSAESVRA